MKKRWLSWDVTRTETYEPNPDMEVVSRLLAGKLPARLTRAPNEDQEDLYRLYRRNWGLVYRALRRLYSHGYINAYWFFRSGELRVSWWQERPFKRTVSRDTFRIVNNSNVTWLPRPSEPEEDKRKTKPYAALRPSTAAKRPKELKTLPLYTEDILRKIKEDNFRRKVDILEQEASLEVGGACYNWDEYNSRIMAKKYDVQMVFWRSETQIKRENKEQL